MTRTWDENREAINGLWPMLTLTDEERKLWGDDLSSLDQGVLYEALREVKRSHESPWPQLALIHGAYRQLAAAKAAAERMAAPRPPAFSGDRLVIDQDVSRMIRDRFLGDVWGNTSEHDLERIRGGLESSIDSMDARHVLTVATEIERQRARLREMVRGARENREDHQPRVIVGDEATRKRVQEELDRGKVTA